ncbi:molybdopterin-guanine dinucleotide biosynthesis protein B, partial [Candidatus Aerophobetes bacterium]|nr:molybdopterin-guanine dinucleotide biosynthesis protein B [Candidatus Aerophobetes bacterium]
MSRSERYREPFIVGIVGKSDTGKTTLILKLVPELARRGYRVAVVKDCPHGFHIDREGKDSWRFSQAGSQGVLLSSEDRFALIRTKGKEDTHKTVELITSLFFGFDLVLVEGYKSLAELAKIEILRRGISEHMNDSLGGVIAVISDFELVTDKPLFKPEEVGRIVDFLEQNMEKMEKVDKDRNVEIIINGKKLPVNHFVKRIVENVVLAVVEPLKRKEGQEA